MSGVKKLVTYFKDTNLNSQLTNILKQEEKTRRNSELTLINFYRKMKQEVTKIVSINDDILDELSAFLEPFKECSEALSGFIYPTINLVDLHYSKLEKHIMITDNDSADIKLLKVQAAHCFKEYCVIESFHYAACMLDPRSALIAEMPC